MHTREELQSHQSLPETSGNNVELTDSSASYIVIDNAPRQPPRDETEYLRIPPAKPPGSRFARLSCVPEPKGYWKPTSLHFSGTLIICLLLHIAVYCVARHYSQKRGIFVGSSQSYDWIFRFAPSLVAVLILAWCTQIFRDYTSIAPFFPRNVSARYRYKPRLYSRSARHEALSKCRPKVLIGCAFLTLLANSTILRKILLENHISVASTSSSTLNKKFIAALAETVSPPSGLDWENIQGSMTKAREGWVVNDISFSASIVVQLIMVLTIISLRIRHLPFRWKWNRDLRSAFDHRSTGLLQTPSKLVTLAEIFRAPEVRHIFQGIDAASPAQGRVALLERMSSLGFRHRIKICQKRLTSAIHVYRGAHERPQFQVRLSLTKHRKTLLRIRHAFVPGILRKTVLIVMILLILLSLGLGAYLVTANKPFYFWVVNSVIQSASDSRSAWTQQLLFVLLPLLLLSIFWVWGWKIDTFYRASQPYAKLYTGCTGPNSICLDYVHTSLFLLPFTATFQGHLRLAWLSLLFLLGSLVLVLPAGLFMYEGSLVYDQMQAKPSQSLTTGRYQSGDGLFDQDTFQSVAVKAVLGSIADQSWANGNTMFPEIELDSGTYDVVWNGLSADLQCRQTVLEFEPQSLCGRLGAKLNDGQLGRFEWSDFCYFDTEQLSSSDGQAMVADVNACPTQKTQPSSIKNNLTSTSTVSTRLPSITSSFSSITSSLDRISSSTKVTVSAPASTRPGTTDDCFQWYTPQVGDTCRQIAQALGIDWETLRQWNTEIDSDCRNLQAGVPYCVDGMLGLARTRLRERKDLSTTSCTGWTYIPSECTLTKSGFWLLVNAQGPFISTSKTQTGLSSVERSTSLICTPNFLSKSVNITVASSVNSTVRQNNVVSSNKIDIETWPDPRTGQQFNDYFGTQLIQNGFGGSYKQLSDGSIVDRISLLAASNSTNFTDGFHDPSEFQRIASYAFGLVFATIASKPVSSDNSTVFFQSAESQSNLQSVQVKRHILAATVDPVPLYIIMGYLALVGLSIPCIYLPRSRRTPLDPRHPANAIVNIYDSAFIQEVQNIVDRGGDPEAELKARRFAFGVYEGVSTRERRLGIDFAERVTIVNSRNRQASSDDEEKMSMISVDSLRVPEAAEPPSAAEFEGRGEYNIPVVRLAAARARGNRDSDGFETARGYQPVPYRVDSDNVVFQSGVDDTGKSSPLSWLKGVMKGKPDGTTISVRDVGVRSGSEGSSLSSTVRRNWQGLMNLMKGPLAN